MPGAQDDDQSGNNAEGQSQNRNEVHHVAIKPVQFVKEEPDLYFLQMEAQFRNSGIKRDQTMYDYVIATLDPKYLQVVSHIIRNPPSEEKYKAVKDGLIREFMLSDHRKLSKLVKEIELGDDKPSQLLRKMRDLAGNAITDEVMKTLWLERLPENIRAVVSVSEFELDKRALIADTMLEVVGRNYISQVNKCSSPSTSSSPNTEINDLKFKIDVNSQQIL